MAYTTSQEQATRQPIAYQTEHNLKRDYRNRLHATDDASYNTYAFHTYVDTYIV
jgi:hypothetical protein